jgi:predicted membrane protein
VWDVPAWVKRTWRWELCTSHSFSCEPNTALKIKALFIFFKKRMIKNKYSTILAIYIYILYIYIYILALANARKTLEAISGK